MKRAPNPVLLKWIAHVKKMSRKFGLKYNEALRDPRVKGSFKR